MTVIADALRLLEGESAVFAFLPGVNYFYYYLQQSNPQTGLIAETLFTVLVSAFLYNFLTEGTVRNSSGSAKDADETRKGDDGDLNLGNAFIFIIIFLPWVYLFGKSLFLLHSLFGSNTPWAELLGVISATFVFLLVSDIVLHVFVSGYGGENSS